MAGSWHRRNSGAPCKLLKSRSALQSTQMHLFMPIGPLPTTIMVGHLHKPGSNHGLTTSVYEGLITPAVV